MGIVIYAFPGSGKTEYCKNNLNAIELASEKYHWNDYSNKETEESKGNYKIINKDWPNNYLIAIKESLLKYDYVFVTHSGSKLCEENKIPYYIIYPEICCKEEYINRMILRKNSSEFIENMNTNYENYILDCEKNNYASKKYILKLGEYLSDIMKRVDNERFKELPILDKFYCDSYSLTAKSNFNCYKSSTKDYIKNNNINFTLITFDNNLINLIKEQYDYEIIGRFYSGIDYHDIISFEGFIAVNSFLGGPNASGLMEELASYGIKYFFAVGSAGLLDKNIDNSIMLVNRAIRDEGTSYQYIEASTYCYPDYNLNKLILNELDNLDIKYNCGTIWTTDSYYREGLERINKRILQGAKAVDMECATWCSVANSINLSFSQLVYFSDCFTNQDWNKHINKEIIKQSMTELGINLSKKLTKTLKR